MKILKKLKRFKISSLVFFDYSSCVPKLVSLNTIAPWASDMISTMPLSFKMWRISLSFEKTFKKALATLPLESST